MLQPRCRLILLPFCLAAPGSRPVVNVVRPSERAAAAPAASELFGGSAQGGAPAASELFGGPAQEPYAYTDDSQQVQEGYDYQYDAAAESSPWVLDYTVEGHPYWYNYDTGESSWYEPEQVRLVATRIH